MITRFILSWQELVFAVEMHRPRSLNADDASDSGNMAEREFEQGHEIIMSLLPTPCSCTPYARLRFEIPYLIH